MRRFKFRLEAVLHHREIIEELREQEFMAAQSALQAIQARIAALREGLRETVLGRPGSRPGERLNAPDILDRERYLATLEAAIAQQERRAEAAQLALEERRQALVAARQAREIVSRLRDKDKLAHTALGLKLEQEALDELATLSHVRAAREALETARDWKEKAA